MIKGRRIDLKPIDRGDMELLRVWRNKYGNDFFTSETITKQQQRAWYQHYQDNYGRDFMYLIKTKEGVPIGTIALCNVDMGDRTAEIGRILLLESFRSQGYMEEALQLVITEAFDKIRVWKLRLSCYLDNAGAIALYNKVGFQSLKRPVMIMEMRNIDYERDDYESQCTNIV